jgi:hypothetical protein
MSGVPFADQRAGGGMVLLELMIALFVFTLVAFSLVMALDAGMKAGAERDEIAAATRGLANQMALLHQGPLVPSDRDLPPDDSGITYHLLVEPAQYQDQKNQPVPNLYRATITAKWTSGHDSKNRSVSELIYQP